MSKKNLILIIIISLIIGATLGYFFGLWQSRQMISKKLPEVKPQEGIITNLEKLKMVGNWSTTVSGKVTKISGRTLTLTSNGEILEIPITEGAKIFTFLPSTGEKPEAKEIEFKDIKIGDRANVTISITDNQLRGVGILLKILE